MSHVGGGRGQDAGIGRRAVFPTLVVVGLLLAGGVGGVVWEALWTPPSGAAVAGEFVFDGPGARSAFSGTVLFVLVSAVVGLVAGVLVGVLVRRDEALAVVAAVVGAVGATALMYAVGHALGPPDPAVAAADAEDLTPLRDQLTLAGGGPWLVLTAGVLVGLVVTLLGSAGRSRRSAGTGEIHGHESPVPGPPWSDPALGSPPSSPSGPAR